MAHPFVWCRRWDLPPRIARNLPAKMTGTLTASSVANGGASAPPAFPCVCQSSGNSPACLPSAAFLLAASISTACRLTASGSFDAIHS